jgi:hypothetical protein
MFLVLDGCEHALDGAAATVARNSAMRPWELLRGLGHDRPAPVTPGSGFGAAISPTMQSTSSAPSEARSETDGPDMAPSQPFAAGVERIVRLA